MLFKELLEFVVVAWLLVELVVPLILGRPVFPMFRRRKATRLLAEENELMLKLEEDRVAARVEGLRKLHEHPEEKEETKNV